MEIVTNAKRIWRVDKETGEANEILCHPNSCLDDHLSGYRQAILESLKSGHSTIEDQCDGKSLVVGPGRIDFLLSSQPRPNSHYSGSN